jgi:hypothetical protein
MPWVANLNSDGFVKSPSAALRFIIPQDLRALHLELFTVPSSLMTFYEFINSGLDEEQF